MSTHMHTEIAIQATPERVWEVLTDFAAYPTWNPFIPHLAGRAAVGTSLDVQLQPPGGRAMRLRPTVLAATHRAASAASTCLDPAAAGAPPPAPGPPAPRHRARGRALPGGASASTVAGSSGRALGLRRPPRAPTGRGSRRRSEHSASTCC